MTGYFQKALLIGAFLGFESASIAAYAADSLHWDGPYAGFTAGTAIGTAKMKHDPSGSFLGPLANDITDGNFWRRSTDLDSTAFTGGVFAGYQQQHDRVVLGIEAEINYLGLDENASATSLVAASGNTYRLDQSVKTDLFASLRPRVGYVPEALSGNLMVFGTAGVTLTRAQIEQKFTQLNNTYYAQGFDGDHLLVGWTLGAGAEYALSQNWSLKAEYLYADLGAIKNHAPGNTGFTGYSTDNQVELTSHILRLGTAYHF